MTKIRTICVDTLTGIQVEEYMRDKKKASHDKWKDWGQDIWTFITDLQHRGFELVLVLGEPGTSKSSGMRTLKHDTNIWYNADNKNPVWEGGTTEYGKKFNPRTPFHVIPTSYKEVINHIDEGLNRGMFENERYAFITGHIETFKSGNETMQRLKTLGNMATQMQLEGKLESVFYSVVENSTDGIQFLLQTQNNGFNTARSPQNLFEPKISNDYQFILEGLMNYN